jgi:large subunit ribosomal protein L11
MAKKVAGFIKLEVPAGQAAPSQKVGPALGQRGINIMEFCKAFNARTQDMEKGSPVPVIITYFQDKSFTFQVKTPPVSYFLRKAAGIEKGSGTPGRGSVGTISQTQVRDIAAKKLKDLNTDSVDAAARMVAGTARAMGLTVEG